MGKMEWFWAMGCAIGMLGCIAEEEGKKAPAPFKEMYMVGDAAPSGWNIKAPDTLKQDPANPYLWKWHGLLYTGEIKFPTYAGTWSADYFMPLSPAQKNLKLTETRLVVNGTPDYKWMITDSTMGEYDIVLDTRTPAIHFTKTADLPTF